MPADDKGCGVAGQIMLVAIAVAVTVITKGATAKFFGTNGLDDVFEGFRLQHISDSARANGDQETGARIGARAAYFMTRHEQQRLQDVLWDNQVASFFANRAQRPASIYIGPNKWDDGWRDQQSIGVIRPPQIDGLDVTDLEDRRAIAANAFDFMRDRTFLPAARGNTRNFDRAQAAFTRLLDPVNHYQPLNAFQFALEARHSLSGFGD
jgi:hypothetical protein